MERSVWVLVAHIAPSRDESQGLDSSRSNLSITQRDLHTNRLINIFSRPIGDRGFAWSIRETDLSPRPRTRWLTAEMGGPDGNGVTFGFFSFWATLFLFRQRSDMDCEIGGLGAG